MGKNLISLDLSGLSNIDELIEQKLNSNNLADLLTPMPLKKLSERSGIPIDTLSSWAQAGIIKARKVYLPYGSGGKKEGKTWYSCLKHLHEGILGEDDVE